MHKVICRQCGKDSLKYDREGRLFCNNICYFAWKRKHPNKKAYHGRIFVSGYFYLYKPDHPNAIKQGRYIAEHRYILEQKIGRLLMKNEIAHHLNGNKGDNRPENLEVLTISEHNRIHAVSRKRNKYGKF